MAGAKPHFTPPATSSAASHSDSAAYDSIASADADADVIVVRLLLPRAFGDEDAVYVHAAIVPLRRHIAEMQVDFDILEDYPEDSASRVAVVLGPTSPSRRVEASSSLAEALQLSPVQEALVALVEVDGVLQGVVGRGHAFLKCLVLFEAARLNAQGRGTLRAIATETGAAIRVTSLAGDTSLHSPDEIVEITGDRTTIRKAIVALSSYVQGDLRVGFLTTSVTTASPKLTMTTFEVPETNFRALPSGGSTQYVTGDVKSKEKQQISFRLLSCQSCWKFDWLQGHAYQKL